MKRPYGWSFPVAILLMTVPPVAAASSSSSSSLTTPSLLSPPRLTAHHNQNRHSRKSIPTNNILAKSIIRSLSRSSPAVLLASTTTTSHKLSAAHDNDSNEVALASQVTTTTTAPPQSSSSSSSTVIMKEVMKIPPFIMAQVKKRNPPKNAGYYYGIQPDKIFPYNSSRHRVKQQADEQQVLMATALTETLEEMKYMRKELQTLRREMYEMRKKITGEKDLEFEGGPEEQVDPEAVLLAKQKRLVEFDRLGEEVETWARALLFEEERTANGWTEVMCNKMLAKTVNPDGRTSCYVNYTKDPRGKHAVPGDDREYPMIKVYSTIDGSIEDVCTYLSRQEHMLEYNGILTEQRDLEVISPHSKISWATSPQILFVKPREFVSFLHHRWLPDGSVVIANQAVEHKDAPPENQEGKGKACRALALRGATFISPDPDDPEKTRFAMIATAAPGGGLPHWMIKTGMNAVVPIEPFNLFHYINSSLPKFKPELERIKLERAQEVSVPGRSNQPVGFASIGFAGFWPNGGGLLPSSSSKPTVNTGSDNVQEQPQPEAAVVALAE